MRPILIVTTELDVHADLVVRRLEQLGVCPIRVHPETFSNSRAFTFRFDGRADGCIRTAKGIVRLSEVGSVWWRKPREIQVADELSAPERRFARREFDHVVKGLWHMMDCYWLSHPSAIRAANYKPDQLRRAADLGLKVPKTLITTCPQEARDFFEDCSGRMIYKTLSSPMLHVPNGIIFREEGLEQDRPLSVLTQVITRESLQDNIESILNAPCQFQQHIEKACEYRVTMIEDEVFIARIDSQRIPSTRNDWRVEDVFSIIDKGVLPDSIIKSLQELMRGYGLNYSAADLIEDSSGEIYFLESNPNGQFYFVERCIPEFRMIDAVCNALIRGAQRTNPRMAFSVVRND